MSPTERTPLLLTTALVLASLAGCAGWQAPPPAPVVAAPPPPPPPAPPPPPPVTVYVPVVDAADQAARQLLAFHERLAGLPPAALAQELTRLGDGSASPQATMELALVLGSTRAPGDLARAQALLEALQRDPQAEGWRGLARLLASRLAEQRRAEEQVERLAQQLRDLQREHQRRLDQLNEKLEALKAIERSLNTRPGAAPASAPRPSP